MSRQLSRKLQRTGRRGFLKTLASIGVSAPALKGLTQDEYDELIDDPRREVPRVLAFKAKDKRLDKQREKLRRGELPEREPVYYKITRSEWRRVESAHDARQRLENRLSHHSDSIGVMVTTNENGKKEINVNISTADGKSCYSAMPAIEDELNATVINS